MLKISGVCRFARRSALLARAPLIGLCLLATAPSRVSPLAAGATGTDLQIETLSNRPDMVSGGDVLVRVNVPAAVAMRGVRVTLNSTDITGSLKADEPGRTLTGLVKGLTAGSNVLAAATSGTAGARLVVVNHPITGPVFAGPKEQPFVCETGTFKLRSGGTLGPSLDADCSVKTRVDYLYRSAAGGELKPLPDPRNPPSDVARTTTSLHQNVRYIVRVETGTINRAIYQIALLHDPASQPAPDFSTRPAGWNGRLIYTFGGGCEGGWYHQATDTGGVEDDTMLRQGYAIASSSLNVARNNCDQVLSAETLMMVKERFIEAYGPPLFTMGFGGSGGAYQQNVIAEAYPGLLDGIMPMRSFPDMFQSRNMLATDARLLNNYFRRASTPYSDEQKRRISGYLSVANMMEGVEGASRIHPTEVCPEVLPAAARYDPIKNPKGARCDIYDHAVNIFGRDAKTGFARRPLDNVGVQYGLGALNAGAISKEQFLELNEKIGGFDADANMVAERTSADPEVARIAYRSGAVTTGGGGLSSIPIIDYREYRDDNPKGDSHQRHHSFSLRARLQKANGTSDNQIILVDPGWARQETASPGYIETLAHLDRWLTVLAEDMTNDPKIAKIRRAKPAGLQDGCWSREEGYERILETQAYHAPGRCETMYPAASFPRGVAGAPIATDVIKCQLKPIDTADYKVTFTAGEMTRLKKIFTGGVCDWSKPGVGYQKAVAWLTYNTR